MSYRAAIPPGGQALLVVGAGWAILAPLGAVGGSGGPRAATAPEGPPAGRESLGGGAGPVSGGDSATRRRKPPGAHPNGPAVRAGAIGSLATDTSAKGG